MEEFRQGLRELKAEEKWRGGDNNRGGLPKRDPSLGLQRSEKPRKSEGSTEKVGCEIGKSGGHENRRSFAEHGSWHQDRVTWALTRLITTVPGWDWHATPLTLGVMHS